MGGGPLGVRWLALSKDVSSCSSITSCNFKQGCEETIRHPIRKLANSLAATKTNSGSGFSSRPGGQLTGNPSPKERRNK